MLITVYIVGIFLCLIFGTVYAFIKAAYKEATCQSYILIDDILVVGFISVIWPVFLVGIILYYIGKITFNKLVLFMRKLVAIQEKINKKESK